MMKRAYILSGSNINPIDNTLSALGILNRLLRVCKLSMPWETQAIGSDGPDFLNIAIGVDTENTYDELKKNLNQIEQKLGRVRTSDKNAARTIDLDIIIYDENVMDNGLWRKLFIAAPMAELIPHIRNSVDGRTLRETADDLMIFGGGRQMPSMSRYFTFQCNDED